MRNGSTDQTRGRAADRRLPFRYPPGPAGNEATREEIPDERNTSLQDWSQINTTSRQDIPIRETNAADRGQIRDNRQQIRDDRGDTSSS